MTFLKDHFEHILRLCQYSQHCGNSVSEHGQPNKSQWIWTCTVKNPLKCLTWEGYALTTFSLGWAQQRLIYSIVQIKNVLMLIPKPKALFLSFCAVGWGKSYTTVFKSSTNWGMLVYHFTQEAPLRIILIPFYLCIFRRLKSLTNHFFSDVVNDIKQLMWSLQTFLF